jgi:hypothetical protein
MIENGKRYLITTDDWFFAPDGEQYKSVWGTCSILNIKEIFGFDPLRPSTNWYVFVGSINSHVIIAGCRVHYAVRCEQKPKSNFEGKSYTDKDNNLSYSANRIFYAE